MQDASQEGRTVVFVSHNMEVVNGLCKRSILLEHGEMTFDGSSEMCIRKYLSTARSTSHNLQKTHKKSQGIASLSIHQEDEQADSDVLDTEKATCFSVLLESDKSEDVNVTICISSANGSHVTEGSYADYFGRYLSQGRQDRVDIKLPKGFLQPGEFYCRVWLDNRFGQSIDHYQSQVIRFQSFGPRQRTSTGRKAPRGSVQPPFHWSDSHIEKGTNQ